MGIPRLNKKSKLLTLFFALAAISPLLLPTANAQQGDADADLIQEEGWQLVQATCTECHTSQIIVQNSGNREVWKSRLTWMQETQGLGQLEVDVENSILDYLAMNYGQKASSRRPGLSGNLLPDNPYPTTN